MGKEHYALGDLKAQNISVPFTCLYNCLGMGALYLLQISCRTRGPHHPHSWTAICFGLPSSQTLSPASFSKEPEWHARNNALPREHIWSPLSTVPVFVVQLRARYYFTSDLVRLGGNRWGKKKKKKSKSLGLQVKNDTKNFSAQPSFVNINIFHSPVDSQTTYYGSRGRLGRR